MRRGMLLVLNSISDPLGLVAPCILPAKTHFETTVQRQTGIRTCGINQAQKWFMCQKDIQQLSNFRVSRSFKLDNFGSTKSAQLHHFTDASENM